MDRAAARERLYRRFIAEEIAGSLRHRLVNKLAGVGALAFHLKRQLPAGPSAAAAASVLPLLDAEVGEASAALDRRFLPPARPDSVPLVAALTETLRAFEPARTAGVELVGPAADPSAALVEADELDLAVFCLLENACEALGAGVVRLRCQEVPGADGMVAVEVIDDGPALPSDARNPFFTTKPGRLGLGLNVAERVALRAGGRLELDGGAGVTARLVLPRGTP
jgi:signal transduction histidine kinase